MDDKVRPSTSGPAADIAARLGLDARKPKPSRARLLMFIGAGVLMLAVAIALLRPAKTQFVAAKAEITPLTVIVTATGTLEPLTEVDVGAEISGRINTVNVDFNDHVTAGQILAVLDTQELKARSIQSEATLANARATLTESRLKRERVAALTKKGASSQADLDAANAGYDRAVAAVNQATALLDIDRTNLGRAEIRSPIDGIVLDRKIEPGQTVASMFQTPVLFTIAQDLTRMQLHVDVDEADIGQVRAGEPARFTVDAYPDRNFDARVATVRFAPRTKDGVVSYEGLLDVANADLALRPGMTATAEITVEKLDQALTVPNGALRFTPPGYAVKRTDKSSGAITLEAVHVRPNGQSPPVPNVGPGHAVVWLKGRAPKPVVVKTGASDGMRTLVSGEAIAPGTEVLVDVARKVKSGGGS